MSRHTKQTVFQDDIFFGDEEDVQPMHSKSESVISSAATTPFSPAPTTPFSPAVSTPSNVQYVKSFDCEANNVTTVRVPFEREKKASKVFQSPFTQQPPTTPRRHIKRHRQPTLPKIIGPHGREIKLKPFKEVFGNIIFF